MNVNNVFQPLQDFAEQSMRVINVTHKPNEVEYKQIALSTGLGIAVVGVIGFVLAMVAHFLRVL